MNLTHLRTLITERGGGDLLMTALFALTKDLAVYLAGVVMIGLGNFILVPLYTRYLAPAEFGLYSLLDITILIMVTVTQLGLGVSYLKWYADIEKLQHGKLLGSTLIAGTVAAALGGGLMALGVASPLGRQWLQTDTKGFALMLAPIVVLENVQGLLLTDLRARRKPVAFSVAAVVRLLMIVGASLWFIVVQGKGIHGVFLGRLVGDSGGVLLLLFLCLHSVTPGFAGSIVIPMVRYGLPLVWSALMGMMLDASGRYFLGHYSTLDQVGFYGAAIKIANVFQMLVYQPFMTAWGGLMFRMVKWPNARLIYSKILAYVFVIALTVALILAIFAPTLFTIFATAAYAPAMMVFPLILLMRAVNVMEGPAAIGIHLAGRTKWFAFIYTIGLAVNLLGNYMLTPIYGMFGAGWVWLISWAVITGLMAWMGQRYYPLQYNWKLFLFPLIPWLFVLIGGDSFHNFIAHLAGPVRVLLALLIILGVVTLLNQDARWTRKQMLLERAG